MSERLIAMKEEIASGVAQIFDVREKEEWNDGHLKDATFVPLSDLDEGIEPPYKDMSLKTYVYCRTGVRALTAQIFLQDMGYREVIPLHETLADLQEAGFEIEI